MARPKKEADKYDFNAQFPNIGEARPLLETTYSKEQLFDKAYAFVKADREQTAGSHYWLWNKLDAIQSGAQTIDYLNNWDWNNLVEVIVAHGDPIIDDHHAKFVAWYDANPAAQELYQKIAPNMWSFRGPNNQYLNGGRYNTDEDKTAVEAYKKHPNNAFTFRLVIDTQEARQFIETSRPQKFQEGDIVVLRAPFVGNHRYDPHWRTEGMKAEDLRYGTVMVSDTDKFNYRSRGGKGSRLISVMWMGLEESETVALPERCLKWESRKRS